MDTLPTLEYKWLGIWGSCQELSLLNKLSFLVICNGCLGERNHSVGSSQLLVEFIVESNQMVCALRAKK